MTDKISYYVEFYFNYPASFIGTLIPDSEGGRELPHEHFIATPLLPCGSVDAPVKKFTGNGSINEAIDHMTKAIHAFAHFSVVYSSSNLVFCDLQGAQKFI